MRRFGDLQVHAALKQCLRRRRVNELLKEGKSVPEGVTKEDLGLEGGVPVGMEESRD